MSRTWTIIVAAIVSVGALGAGLTVGGAFTGGESEPAAPAVEASLSRGDSTVPMVGDPDRMIPRIMADRPDPIPVVGERDEETFYVSKADFEAMLRAYYARRLGGPYSATDELAPARDASGKLVGYWTGGAGFISLEAATSPDFDLCKLRAERSASSAAPDCR